MCAPLQATYISAAGCEVGKLSIPRQLRYSYVRKFSSFRKFSACESSKSFMAMTAQKLAWNSTQCRRQARQRRQGAVAAGVALGSVEMKLREKPGDKCEMEHQSHPLAFELKSCGGRRDISQLTALLQREALYRDKNSDGYFSTCIQLGFLKQNTEEVFT